MSGINNIAVRFFIYDDEAVDGDFVGDIVECDETAFLECKYPIRYERHTIFENGCNQICLTKMPED